jgi:hypothetical protein
MESILGRFDNPHGDEDYCEYSRAEILRIEREARRLAEEKLADVLWWNARMEGMNALSAEVPTQLARMMGNLEPARRGEAVAVDAITTALHYLRRLARRDAEAEARDEAEQVLLAGDL